MGWARLLFLGNVGQQLDLSTQQAQLNRLREQASMRRLATERTDTQLIALRRENDELKVSLAAIVRILAQKQILTEDEVNDVVAATESAGED